MIKALIFDFDGLILDTETPEYETWLAIYRENGVDLPIDQYLQLIGTDSSLVDFAPIEYLAGQTGDQTLRRTLVNEEVREQWLAVIESNALLPGVTDHIRAAKDLGLGLAVASSSRHDWVDRHLSRLGIVDCFDSIICGDDVERVKPHPDLFQAALDALNVQPQEAIVYEDSVLGITAAKQAGIYAVAVPNLLTVHSDFSHADRVIASLSDVPLASIIEQAHNGQR
ncbi:MAG: HAD-IA family hydrolase [Anaerolineae bacterium]|nr:HAD-IA family hydrolase [Anaerolineae bacterium]